MYKITKPKPTWETQVLTRDRRLRPICIRVEPVCVAFKQKGMRTWYRLPYSTLYDLAVRAAAEAKRRAKIEARKSKKPQKRGRLR